MTADQTLLCRDDILLDVHTANKARLFDEVAKLFARRHGLAADKVVDSLAARERLGSTGLGHGIALPHARLAEARGIAAAFVRPQFPLPFDAPDGKPVSDFLVLIVPPDSPQQHLQLLSEIAALFGDRAFRERLRHAEHVDAVLDLFQGLRMPAHAA